MLWSVADRIKRISTADPDSLHVTGEVVTSNSGGYAQLGSLGFGGEARLDRVDLDCWFAPVGTETTPMGEILGLVAAPNPFSSSVNLQWSQTGSAPGRIRVLDVRGRVVALAGEGPAAPGVHRLTWSGRDSAGWPIPSGVYFVELQLGGRREVAKIVSTR
jgi:hypothetical protein